MWVAHLQYSTTQYVTAELGKMKSVKIMFYYLTSASVYSTSIYYLLYAYQNFF